MSDKEKDLMQIFREGIMEAQMIHGVSGCSALRNIGDDTIIEGAKDPGEIVEGTLPRMTTEDMIPGLEVFPFVGFVWNSVYAKEDWSADVDRAKYWHDKVEYWMVKEGARKCGTIHLYPQNFDTWIEKIENDNLVWLPLQRTKNYTGFAHRHYPVDKIDMDTSVYGVISTKMEYAEAFREASKGEKGVDHKTIGELLGFPKCCSDKFDEWWPKFVDPVYQTAEESPHKVWRGENYSAIYLDELHIATHQMLRYPGFRLTSHFACSSTCEHSIEIGKTWVEVGMKYDPRGYESLVKIMQLPGEWSVLNGISVVETEPFTITTNSMPTSKKFAIRWDKVTVY